MEFGSGAVLSPEAAGKDVNSIHYDVLFMKDTLMLFGGSLLLSPWMVSIEAESENTSEHLLERIFVSSLLLYNYTE